MTRRTQNHIEKVSQVSQVVKGWLKLPCCTYTEKRARRVVGEILWAVNPYRTAILYLKGSCFAPHGALLVPPTPSKSRDVSKPSASSVLSTLACQEMQ